MRSCGLSSFSLAAAIAAVLFASLSFAEVRPEQVVGKVHNAKLPIGVERVGSAWCLTDECDYMITNYHVVRLVGSSPRVNREKVRQWWIATGPDDEGARDVPSFTEIYKFNMVRDIAILKMAKTMSATGMRAVRLFTGEVPQVERVTIVSYPGGKLRVTTGYFDAVMADGLMKFQLDADLVAGASGGLVMNSNDEAIGLLCGVEKSHRAAYAVPVWSIAEFLKNVQPQLYAKLIGSEPHRPKLGPITVTHKLPETLALLDYDPEPIAPAGSQMMGTVKAYLHPSAILSSNFLAAHAGGEHFQPLTNGNLQVRAEETTEVVTLRKRAAEMVHEMSNFTAVQTLTLPDNSVWQHEVKVIDGHQVFVTNSGKQLDQLPIPQRGVVPGDEWKGLADMVGTNLRLPLRYVGDRYEDGTVMKVFEYRAAKEDAVCGMRIKKSFFKPTWKGSAPCHGDVWTDADLNILRITQEIDLPREAGMQSCTVVVLYGWLRHESFRDRLVPASMYLRAQEFNGHTIESTAQFSAYQVFHASARVIENVN